MILYMVLGTFKTMKLNKYFISDKESGETLAIVEAENKVEASKIAEKEYDIDSITVDKA